MKSKKILIVVLVLVVLAVLAVPAANMALAKPAPSIATINSGDAALDDVAALMAAKCGACHASDGAVPWYGSLPVMSGLIHADMTTGLQFMDYAEALGAEGGRVDEVMLAKTEHVVGDGVMPPTRYVALHWDASLSAEDTTMIEEWIRSERAAHYAVEGVSADLAGEPIQPLPESIPADAAKAALGDRLFHDVRLSKDDSISCASCHDLAKGGTDQVQYSTGVGNALGGINSPTVFNAAFHVKQFWDGRAADLVEQADGPVNNPIEMASDWDAAKVKLEQDAEFTAAFMAVYPQGYTKEACTEAIAEFEKTLVTPNSRFDLFLKGQEDALTEQERAGYATFKETGCVMCHVGKAMGGQSFERMGRKGDYFAKRGNLTDADNGRFNVTKDESDRHAFRTPTLRNIALTFPYFHDGSTLDLAEAADVMATTMLDVTLSEEETLNMVAFLRALTGQYKGQDLAAAVQ